MRPASAWGTRRTRAILTILAAGFVSACGGRGGRHDHGPDLDDDPRSTDRASPGVAGSDAAVTPVDAGAADSGADAALEAGAAPACQPGSVACDAGCCPVAAATLGVGAENACAVVADGGVACWGFNPSGQLGSPSPLASAVPLAVPSLAPVLSLSAGFSHVCAVTTAGDVACWGDDNAGQLGDGRFGQSTSSTTPTAVRGLPSPVASVAAGNMHTCALTVGGALWCWGNNVEGSLGDGTTDSHAVPVAVPGLETGVVAVSAGGEHTCALTTRGDALCWGWNKYGQLGDGTTTSRLRPTAVAGLPPLQAVMAGELHTCALSRAGAVYCWGLNETGQLGDGTITNSSVPVAVAALASGVAGLALAGSGNATHSCAWSPSTVWCWGHDALGELGNGSTTDSHIPVAVSGIAAGVTIVAIGTEETCATVGGHDFCWGDNGDGQLGSRAGAQSSVPAAVTGL